MKLSDRIEQITESGHGFPVDLDNLLNQWFGQKAKPCKTAFCPVTNVVERETDFTVSIELPGVAVDDVNVEASDEQLTVSGEKRVVDLSESDKLRRSERITGKFNRSFRFPTQVDFEKIKASFELGVLTIVVPKSEKILPRKISIDVG